MTTMIWGSNGFFGINTARCLADRGEEVILVNRHPMQVPPLLATHWGKQVRQTTGDMLNLAIVLHLIKKYKADSLIHAGHSTAGTGHGREFEEPLNSLLRTQIEGAINLYEAAKLVELRRVTFVSSMAVYYGWPHPCEVLNEDAFLPPLPDAPHSAEISTTKRAAEQIGFLYSKSYGISFAAIRTGVNYGVKCFGEINKIVENAIEGKPTDLSAMANSARFDTVNAKDTGELTSTVHLAKSLKNYIYNICDGTHPTLQEIVDTIKEFFPKAEIKLGPSSEKPKIPLPHEINRIKAEFGYVPMTLKQGIEHYANYIKTGRY